MLHLNALTLQLSLLKQVKKTRIYMRHFIISFLQDVAPDMDGRCIVLKPGQERLCIIIT